MERTNPLAVAVFILVLVLASGAAHSNLDPNPAPARRGRHDSAPAPQPRRNDAAAIVSPAAAPAHHRQEPPAPPPAAGADHLPPQGGAFARAHFGFPLQPASPPAGAPGAGEGYPFIGSNPTVPLPTGMTDTATVLPLPDTGDAAAANAKVVGRAARLRVQISMIAFPIVVSILFFLSST